MSISLRIANSQDIETVAKYNGYLAQETEDKTLDLPTLTAGVTSVINDSSLGTYYVACNGDRVIGQLMITYEWSDWRNGCFWWIQSVYVHKQYRQQGIYTKLYEYVSALAHDQGNVCGIRLYVEHNNERAQATYKKLGMDKTHYFIMEEEF